MDKKTKLSLTAEELDDILCQFDNDEDYCNAPEQLAVKKKLEAARERLG